MAIPIPDDLRRTVADWFGDPGRAWLDALPATIAGVAERWGLRLGALPYPGGSHALALPAVGADGRPAVLKVPFLDDENRTEAHALHAYDGDGAVRLYAHDPETGALLLERAEPGTALVDEAGREAALDVLFTLLRRLRRPATGDFPRATALAARWATVMAALPDSGGVAEAVARARAYADHPGPELLVNRDAHLGNVLRAEREPWLLIDPKPVLGEAAFEGGFPVLKLMGDGTEAAVAITRVAAGLAADPERVRGWALIRAVENAAWSNGDRRADLARAAALARA